MRCGASVFSSSFIGTYRVCSDVLIPKPSTTSPSSDGVAHAVSSAAEKQFYSRFDVYLCRCVLFQPYPPTINFLECWIHLSDGSAKVVTLSHHGMKASNDCLREIAVSSNVFENISHPRLLFLHLLLANTWRVSFWLMLSVCASVRRTVLWNGCLVLQDAHSGNSITSPVDANPRSAVTGCLRRPRLFSSVAGLFFVSDIQANAAAVHSNHCKSEHKHSPSWEPKLGCSTAAQWENRGGRITGRQWTHSLFEGF